MMSKYLPEIAKEQIESAKADPNTLFELLAEPLHQELYRRQDFTFMDELSEGQQLIISFDYVHTQVIQGGFIQLIENGYVALLAPMPEWLIKIGDTEMAHLLDDVLKVYVLNKKTFDKSKTLQDFAALYNELTEFEELDSRYSRLHEATVEKITAYALSHLHEFVTLK
jgi:hypothetical protein